MQNRELKKSLVSSGKYQTFCDVAFSKFQNCLSEDEFLSLLGDEFSDLEVTSCEQLMSAKSKQRKRIRNWLEYWLHQNGFVVCFATLTFNDETLSRSFSARQKLIQRTLGVFDDYVSNVDYGAKNEREHYHALVVMSEYDYLSNLWSKNRFGVEWSDSPVQCESYTARCGFVNFQVVKGSSGVDLKRLSGYLAKLCNHSIKVKQTRLGYKRHSQYQKFKKMVDFCLSHHVLTNELIEELTRLGFYRLRSGVLERWLADPLSVDFCELS